MNLSIILLLLTIVSVLTTLCVEAIKTMFASSGKKYQSNIIAAFCAIVLSIIIGIGYGYLNAFKFIDYIYLIIPLVFLGWLCSMLGYDKVIQAISQLKGETNTNA
jgi:hypothetical protein